MRDLQTVARPYAKALFELALQHNALGAWSDALHILALAVEDAEMQTLLNCPEVTKAMLVDILLTVVSKSKQSNEQLELLGHALAIMSANQRLAVLPEVYRQYEAHKEAHNKLCTGIVFTAQQLDVDQMHKLAIGLQKKLNKTVSLSQIIEPSLLGGAKIKIGDMVIDGTLRGRIQRLSQSLSSSA